MGLSVMKQELHQRLWAAQERWFGWKARGESKRGLKLEGLRENGDLFARTKFVLFTGATRLAYERELKRFVEFAHAVRGKKENREIDTKDFRAYMEQLLSKGSTAKHLSKVKSAIVKFGVLYGRGESFAALSRKWGKRIRELVKSGHLAPPARPHISPAVREAVIARLKERDQACPEPRAYHLVCRLQEEASLRAIEATDRLKRSSLLGLRGERGHLFILGKGGRIRTVEVSRDLYERIDAHFRESRNVSLAPLRGYQLALRRAALEVGGRSTGSHAHRRTSATELKNEKYWGYVGEGRSSKEARAEAVADTVEHLGHSRFRKDTAAAYCS